MKKTNRSLPFPSLSIFLIALCAFTPNPILLGAAAASNPVLDIQSQKVRSGNYYFVQPAVRSGYGGGGLTLGAGHNGTTCPLDVVEEQGDYGLPLTLSAVNVPKGGEVRVSTDLNIEFSPRAFETCVESNVWRLGSFDGSTGQYFVTTGGVEGNPGRKTLSNWFKIEEYDRYYKLAFCPTVCGVADKCKVLCRDVGIYVDRNGTRRLALSDVPFKVMFKKV